MTRSRYWTCPRVTAGERCGKQNLNRARICAWCGKPRPKKKQPAHRAALKLTYEHYLTLNENRETCAICGAEPKPGRKLHRDHEHEGNGHARGLLCFRCNTALRPYMTLTWLRSAVTYMERAEARRA